MQLSDALAAAKNGNVTRICIQEKIAELREDELLREDFNRYCDNLKAKARPVHQEDIVERNRANIDGSTPEQWMALQAQRAQRCRARREAHREKQEELLREQLKLGL